MEKTALDFERKFDNVTHVAHTYKYDWHLQHLKNGSTIQSLYNSGKIKHALYIADFMRNAIIFHVLYMS